MLRWRPDYIVGKMEEEMFNYTIISDKEDTKRREYIHKEFQKIGIHDLNFTDAIMATRMSNEEVANYAIPNTFLSKGEIGCVLSHKHVYEKLLHSEYNSIIVFEDDIVFSDECTVEVLSNIVNVVDKVDEPCVVALYKAEFHKKEMFKVDDKISIYSSHNLFGTYSYIINKKAAENILTIQTPVHFEIDAYKFYYWLDAVNLYCINQDLVVPSKEIESVIGANRFDVNNRAELKKRAYKKLYRNLPIQKKIQAQLKRIAKALHKPFETLDY